MALYPTASHSYFAITNREQQKDEFLSGMIDQPQFSYGKVYRPEVIHATLNITTSERERNNLLLVETSMAANKPHANHEDFQRFREENKRIFGEPTQEYVQAILGRIANKSHEHSELWEYVCEQVAFEATDGSLAPSDEMFLWYKELFSRYSKPLDENASLASSLRLSIQGTGLAAKGWQVVETDDATHARVNQSVKKVFVGRHYKPRRASSIRAIVAHEVYGHAVRGPQVSVAESEGFAILLEQLLERRFAYRRTFRYLAAALGWGVDGKRRTFREVYEIIWRLMVIVGRYDQADAKRHAFDECVRVFRGGRPDVGGVVYLKDAVYFAANIQIWQVLDNHKLSYNEFVEIIEGKGVLA